MAGARSGRGSSGTRRTSIWPRCSSARSTSGNKAGAVDYATMLATATAELTSNPQLLADKTVVLLDVAIGSQSRSSVRPGRDRVRADGDRDDPERRSGNARGACSQIAPCRHPRAPSAPDAPAIGFSSICSPTTPPPKGRRTTRWCCSPRRAKAARRSRSRAACCRKPRAACRSIRWRCCCARRRPILACSSTRSIAPAFPRGSIAAPGVPIRPAARCSRCWRAPTKNCRRAALPSTCRSGQVPLTDAGNADLWSPPADEIVEAMLPLEDRAEDVQPEDEAQAADRARRIRARSRRHAARAVALGGSDRRSRGDRPARSLAAPAQGPRARIRSPRSRSQLRGSGRVARARA